MAANGRSRTNWLQTLGILAAVLAPTIAFIYNLSSTIGTIANHTSKLADDDTALYNLQVKVNELAQTVATQRETLKEIETQFCSEDDIRNVDHAEELRFRQMMMQKVFEGNYTVANAVYPVVCDKRAAQ